MSEIDKHQRRIARDVLPNGRVVSTMWLDIICGGNPGGYETMVFPSEEEFHDLDSSRVLSESEAREEHARLVKLWSAKP